MEQKNILIVEDASLMRMVIKQLLKSEPRYHVVGEATNGIEALEQLEKLSIDLILLDLEMPKMDGLVFLRHARLKTDAKIVVLSSLVRVGSNKAKEARQLGANAVISKPSGTVSMDLEQKRGNLIISTINRLLGLE